MLIIFHTFIVILLVTSTDSSFEILNYSTKERRLDLDSDDQVLLSDSIKEQDAYIFATCKDKKFALRIECTVIMTNLTRRGTSKLGKTCNIKRNLEKDTKLMVKQFPLQLQILKDPLKVIMTTTEIDLTRASVYRRLIILDMFNCKTKDTGFYLIQDISTNFLISNVVIYHSSFEIFTADKSKCGDLGKCRLSYDNNGNQVGKPKPVDIDLNYIIVEPISSNSSSSGFFIHSGPVHGTNSTSVSILYMKKSGESSNLFSQEDDDARWSSSRTSNAHGLFTICSRKRKLDDEDVNRTRIDCKQIYSIYNRSRLGFVESYSGIKAFAVHNMKGGGFLLFMLNCDQFFDPVCKTFHVIRVTVDEDSQNVNGVSSFQNYKLHKEINVKNGLSNSGCSGSLERIKIIPDESEDEYCFHLFCVSEIIIQGQRVSSAIHYQRHCLLKFLVQT